MPNTSNGSRSSRMAQGRPYRLIAATIAGQPFSMAANARSQEAVACARKSAAVNCPIDAG